MFVISEVRKQSSGPARALYEQIKACLTSKTVGHGGAGLWFYAGKVVDQPTPPGLSCLMGMSQQTTWLAHRGLNNPRTPGNSR